MFDHVTIRVSDRVASERFYDTVLPVLGIERTSAGEGFDEWDDFSLSPAPEPTRGLHVGFVAPSRGHVDEFWRVGCDAGYPSDGEPGPRPQYRQDYYGAFLLDPDGNSVEAVWHGDLRRGGNVDHLWIRVADVAASRAAYGAIARHARFEIAEDRPDFLHLRGESGSFSLLAGDPTQRLHMAFPASANHEVDAFHAAALSAGWRDNGGPGERPQYHAGYYGAFVLDPDGNNVEMVCHNR